jgi:protein-disulfide isomerase
MRFTRFAVLGLVALAACNGSKADIDDLKKSQQEILAKLDGLAKTVAAIKVPAAAPAGGPAAIDPNKVYTIPISSSPVKGPKDAKVTIVEFSDFQCPFCSQAAALVPDVLKAYPDKVNFVYKQFPLTSIHPFALGAAKAAIAAGKQGKFWEMHDMMFANNKELGVDKLKEYAGKIGLDVPKFEADMNSPETQKQIDQEQAEARSADVQGTPTFFVGGKRLQNRSVDGFKQMIDAQLPKG